MADNSENGNGVTRITVGVWPVCALIAVIFGFMFLTLMSHGERIVKNETNISAICQSLFKIDQNVQKLAEDMTRRE